jgi:hypothetical protein
VVLEQDHHKVVHGIASIGCHAILQSESRL